MGFRGFRVLGFRGYGVSRFRGFRVLGFRADLYYGKMAKRVCKSCCVSEEFDGFKTCNGCREAKRKCYGRNKNEYNQA